MRRPERHRAALDQVLELTVLLNDDMTRSLASDGLTTSRAHLLWELRGRGPATQRVLADALGVSARNVTGLVDGLVESGFVTREPHPADRRATLVSFTERGAATVETMEQGHRALADQLFAGLSARQLECFVDGLGGVLGRLRDQVATDRDKTDV